MNSKQIGYTGIGIIAIVIIIISISTYQQDTIQQNSVDSKQAKEILLALYDFKTQQDNMLSQCEKIQTNNDYNEAVKVYNQLQDKMNKWDFELGLDVTELGIIDSRLREQASTLMLEYIDVIDKVEICFESKESG